MTAQPVNVREVYFQQPDISGDAKTICSYGIFLVGAITSLVIGILALLHAHGVLDCGALIGSISTKGAVTNISGGALGIIFCLSLKPIIVAILRCSTKFTLPEEYPKNAPFSTYTPYYNAGNLTYFVTDEKGKQTTYHMVGAADRTAMEKQLQNKNIRRTPRVALETHAEYDNHGNHALNPFADSYSNFHAWNLAFEKLPQNTNCFTLYGLNNQFDLDPQEPVAFLLLHCVLKITAPGARSIHMFATQAEARAYTQALQGYTDCTAP